MRVYLLALLFCLAVSASAREVGQDFTNQATVTPAYCTATHDIGKMGLIVTNGGIFGSPDPYVSDYSGCHLGGLALEPGWLRADEYPLGSHFSSLTRAGLWVGGITEKGDTLVSVTYARVYENGSSAGNMEFNPYIAPFGEIVSHSINGSAFDAEARSEQDYVAVYTDTLRGDLPGLASDFLSRQWHQPLGLQVKQTSCAWSNSMVDDFILVEYRITNVGQQDLSDCYVGMYMDPGVGHMDYLTPRSPVIISSDDLCGFLPTYSLPQSCGHVDTLNMPWSADGDGDPGPGDEWKESGSFASDKNIAGLRVLQVPDGSSQLSFNWWVQRSWIPGGQIDWGPRYRARIDYEPRNFRTGGIGEPEGDANKYFLLSNGEVDYDQPRAPRISVADPLWDYPWDFMRQWAYADAAVCYLLSVGPFDLAQGEEQVFSIAYVGGENFHSDPANGKRLIAGDVEGWYSHVDFTDLAKNAKMAEWVFDNPGYDTDSDGYAGKFHVCVLDSDFIDGHWVASVAETTYYSGDGVPDWRAVGPPPAPKVWLSPTLNGVKVRFNGLRSETTKDLVSNRLDFEGYNVYIGRDDREASLSLVASFDQADYDKYVYRHGAWKIEDIPFSQQQLRCLYGRGESKCADSAFEPTIFTFAEPYRLTSALSDSIFAFYPHSYNAPLRETSIHRIFPDAPRPIPGQPIPPDQLTPDGYVKYYEYECTISGLLPTVPYFINVTAFDYGDPASGVEALESSKLLDLQHAYPLADKNQLSDSLAPVYVYPNPYYSDGRYAGSGYEDRHLNGSNPDRNRLIHFVNVPASCVIRIYTLDGDLVRAIKHDYDPADLNSHHETWDMINRNIQTVVSGLYYWTVEGSDGKVQMGKLVIIR